MKQRVQIISETLTTISAATDELREAAVDLADCNVTPVLLTRAIASIEGFRNAVAENELRPTLAEPQGFAGGGRADPVAASKISAALDSFEREDPPCIACGAPESVCECEDPDPSNHPAENPGAASEPRGSSDRVTERGAYLSFDDTMLCCGSEPVQISDEDYVCPKCTRICLGSHPEDEEIWAAERAAGWDATP